MTGACGLQLAKPLFVVTAFLGGTIGAMYQPPLRFHASCGRFLEPLAPFPSWLFENSSLAWPDGAVYPAWPSG